MNTSGDPDWSFTATTEEDPRQLLADIHFKARSIQKLISFPGDNPDELLFQGLVLRATDHKSASGQTSLLWVIVTEPLRVQLEFFDLWQDLRAHHRVGGGPEPEDRFIQWRKAIVARQAAHGENKDARGQEATRTQENGAPGKAAGRGSEGETPRGALQLPRSKCVLTPATIKVYLEAWEALGGISEEAFLYNVPNLRSWEDLAAILLQTDPLARQVLENELKRKNIKNLLKDRLKLPSVENLHLYDVPIVTLMSPSQLRRAKKAQNDGPQGDKAMGAERGVKKKKKA
jgi:hypothetical protein